MRKSISKVATTNEANVEKMLIVYSELVKVIKDIRPEMTEEELIAELAYGSQVD